MKYILFNLLLFCTAFPVYSQEIKFYDCYLCSDYKESECFKEKHRDTLRPYNDTHNFVIDNYDNATIISTPCKGHKSDIVKCRSYCVINYDIKCKMCKLHTLKTKFIYKSDKPLF